MHINKNMTTPKVLQPLVNDEAQKQSLIDSFFNLSDVAIAALAQEATKAAVKDLHDRGISTYGMRDGIMYETKPNGETVRVVDPSSKI